MKRIILINIFSQFRNTFCSGSQEEFIVFAFLNFLKKTKLQVFNFTNFQSRLIVPFVKHKNFKFYEIFYPKDLSRAKCFLENSYDGIVSLGINELTLAVLKKYPSLPACFFILTSKNVTEFFKYKDRLKLILNNSSNKNIYFYSFYKSVDNINREIARFMRDIDLPEKNFEQHFFSCSLAWLKIINNLDFNLYEMLHTDVKNLDFVSIGAIDKRDYNMLFRILKNIKRELSGIIFVGSLCEKNKLTYVLKKLNMPHRIIISPPIFILNFLYYIKSAKCTIISYPNRPPFHSIIYPLFLKKKIIELLAPQQKLFKDYQDTILQINSHNVHWIAKKIINTLSAKTFINYPKVLKEMNFDFILPKIFQRFSKIIK